MRSPQARVRVVTVEDFSPGDDEDAFSVVALGFHHDPRVADMERPDPPLGEQYSGAMAGAMHREHGSSLRRTTARRQWQE